MADAAPGVEAEMVVAADLAAEVAADGTAESTAVAEVADGVVAATEQSTAADDEHADGALTADELIEIQATLAAAPTNGRTPGHRSAEHGPAELPAEDVAGRAAAAAAQTADLLARFRPTDGDTDEISLTEETLTAQEDDGFDEPVSLSERLAGAPMEHIEHGPSAVAEPATAEPVAEQRSVVAPAVVPAEPLPDHVHEPIAAELVETAAAAADPKGEPATPATETASRDDRVVQPTWRIVAPDTDGPAPADTGSPAEPVQPTWAQPSAVLPLQPQASLPQSQQAPAQAPQWPAHPPSAEPSWPSAPVWPSQLGRGASRGAEAVWAASNRDVMSQPESGVQACVNCGLALSSTARFCRRCGTSQVHA